MATKIYTRTGDKGKTSLIGGTKVAKSHIRIESYGNVDELNAFLGFMNDQVSDKELHAFLREIQDRLFTIGSSLAADPEKDSGMKLPPIVEDDVLLLEKKIDAMTAKLPPMKSFILPGGAPIVSAAHICRTVCRRAERSCVMITENGSYVNPLVIKYLNRLSDYFFVLSRWLAQELNAEEIAWKPRL